MDRAKRIALFREVDLYPVTCESLSAGRSDIEVLQAAIRGGAKVIQLREKDYGKGELYRLAVRFRELTAAAGMLLIINDHLDVALAAGADGVHLGQGDLPLPAARRIAPELILGASSHSRAEALRAQAEGADYVNIGPIFPTRTKAGIPHVLGPEGIHEIAPVLRVPFTVMGGIDGGNIDQVLAAGARRIAVVTAVTQAPDMAAAVVDLRARIRATGA